MFERLRKGEQRGRARHRAGSAKGGSDARSNPKAASGRGRSERGRSREGVVDHRLDQRRRELVRSRRRKWWIGVSALLGAVVVVVIGWAMLHSALFSVRTMSVVGATSLVRDDVVSAAGISSGEPLISIDTATSATSIEAIPLIKSATVQLRWPSTVQITVAMRTPIAYVATRGRYARIDATGRVLARSQNVPTKFSPVPLEMQVAGVTPGKPGSWLPDRAGPAVKVAAKIPPAFRGQVAKVIGNADGSVSLVMTAPVTILLGSADKLHAKFSDVAAIIAGTALHAGDVVDVSVPQASTISRAAS